MISNATTLGQIEQSPSFDARPSVASAAQIKVIGVGGGGGNAIDHMIAHGVEGVEFICANTDAQALKRSGAHRMLQLGTSGLGAGAKPLVGESCAIEAEQKIREALTGAQMVFITAGLGGGTGTGAAPVIARLAREMGILTVGVVTKPFEFEGSRRTRSANEGLLQLEQHVDSLIVVLNDRLLDVLGDDVSQHEAFAAANDVLRNAVGGITNVIHMPCLVNVDFEDVKTVMEQPGRAMMGTSQCTGPDRSTKAAELAVACPLLEGIDLSGANGILVLITASKKTFRLAETRNVMNIIRRYGREDAHIIMGAAYDDELGDEMRVTVIATGLSRIQKEIPQPTHTSVLPMFIDDLPMMAMPSVYATEKNKAVTPALVARVQPKKTPHEAPSVWRSLRANLTPLTFVSASAAHQSDDIDIPAFLRKPTAC